MPPRTVQMTFNSEEEQTNSSFLHLEWSPPLLMKDSNKKTQIKEKNIIVTVSKDVMLNDKVETSIQYLWVAEFLDVVFCHFCPADNNNNSSSNINKATETIKPFVLRSVLSLISRSFNFAMLNYNAFVNSNNDNNKAILQKFTSNWHWCHHGCSCFTS